MNKESGFTLVEVLIASAILMASIGVLMQLFSSSLGQNRRVGEMAHLLVAEQMIVKRLERINPAVQGKGEGVAEVLTYAWSAKRIEPFHQIYKENPDVLHREAALFRLTIVVQRAQGVEREFSFDLLGWRVVP